MLYSCPVKLLISAHEPHVLLDMFFDRVQAGVEAVRFRQERLKVEFVKSSVILYQHNHPKTLHPNFYFALGFSPINTTVFLHWNNAKVLVKLGKLCGALFVTMIFGSATWEVFCNVLHSWKLYTVPLMLSGALFPLMQWTGRAQFVVVIVQTIDEELPSVFITFLAWSIAEASETVDSTNKTLKANMQEILKWMTMLEILH
ncbi:unnamed protein product [Trifolium pratense]|uniref:Uncharacterized protein n=1 Tax=Trifolium pratense TaxID=57577 RepID=A0ACB0LTC2_TRIPR|nr:unnamed protein product [Trifolium pratense]